jgi:hypothetical protein
MKCVSVGLETHRRFSEKDKAHHSHTQEKEMCVKKWKHIRGSSEEKRTQTSHT